MGKQRILFVSVSISNIVQKDVKLLQEDFDIESYDFGFRSKWQIPFQLIFQFFWLLINCRRFDLVITQLAGYHSFFPVLLFKILGKPSLIIAAGTDCHGFPSIGYGNFNKKWLGIVTSWCMRNCVHIAPKHDSLWHCRYNYESSDFQEQGLQFFIPGLKTPYTVIPNGYDDKLFYPDKKKIKNTFITVSGNLNQPYQSALKGIDLMLKVAVKFPELQFIIVGVQDSHLLGIIPNNVRLVGKTGQNELRELYNTSAFYLQLSIAEGFPNALCEAMLCDCIPIGSNVFAIPEIIGDTGYILKKKDPTELEQLINKAIDEYREENGSKCRERIQKLYPISNRKYRLITLINKLLTGN